MKHVTRALGAILVVALIPAAASAQARGMRPDDYFALRAIADPRISPDGTTVAFVVTSVEQKEKTLVCAYASDASRMSARMAI